ncbi:MAG: phosphate-starvation-inducible PsiE family protein [Gammaproteobacteria bacterium]|nr:phosphate-starvation-inducible PsiE family protein [Gammaproteobacteria bacterium]MDH5801574.1 phosphate-starvation-inducible PsiE family protein [Gammaproteobacteria bacterium]
MYNLKNKLEHFGNLLVDSFHLIALFVIGFTVIWSAAHEYISIMSKGAADLKDILLLFIYLEIGAMLGIYFKTKKLPVVFLIYIAITALTRVLAVDIKNMDGLKTLSVTGAILILAVSGYVLSQSKHNRLDQKPGDTD